LGNPPIPPTPAAEPYLELAAAQMKAQRFRAAEATLGTLLARSPEDPLALSWQGVARAALGRPQEAEELLRRALDRPGSDPVEIRFNLGLVLAGEGRAAEAVPLFEAALAARFNLVAAWVHLGAVESRLDHLPPAAQCYDRAPPIHPSHTAPYPALP